MYRRQRLRKIQIALKDALAIIEAELAGGLTEQERKHEEFLAKQREFNKEMREKVKILEHQMLLEKRAKREQRKAERTAQN